MARGASSTWVQITKYHLKRHWPCWGTFDVPKLVYLRTQLERGSYHTSQNQWKPVSVGGYKPSKETTQ